MAGASSPAAWCRASSRRTEPVPPGHDCQARAPRAIPSARSEGRHRLSQAEELDKVKARIRALAARTVSNGCTEAEAMAAAEMVGRLLDRYALGMDEVELRDARCVQLEVSTGGRRRRPVDGCVPAIARFCDCKVWLAASGAAAKAEARYVFFGFETDVTLAGYLFSVCDRAVDAALATFRAESDLGGTELRRACTNFQHGMAARIGERLERMAAERQAGMAARPAAGTALVLVKHRTVEAAFRETQIRLASGGRAPRRPADRAYHRGRAAAEAVNLSRPVKGGEAARLR